MLFCDVELATRIERAECRLLSDACAVVARRLAGSFTERVCGGFAACTAPGSPLNKIAGLGFAAFDPLELERVESAFVARGVTPVVEIATLAAPEVAQHLTRRGYELVGVENVLGLRLPPTSSEVPRGDVRIDVSGDASFEEWLDVVVTGFATPDVRGVPAHEEHDRAALEDVIRDFARADGVVRFLARRGGRAAGGGSLKLSERIAQLCGASTLPAERRRGVQTALLAARLAHAAAEGAELAVVTTQPGSTSQENAQRRGLELLYARNVLRRGPR